MALSDHQIPEAYGQAAAAYKAGRLEEAERLCNLILADKNDFFGALYLVALVQGARGRKDVALTSFERALAVRPRAAAALTDFGLFLHEFKRYDEAVAAYDRALAARPGFALAHFRRGNALHELKRYEEALASYDRAVELRPGFAFAYFNRGETLQQLNRHADAVVSYERALALRPGFAKAYSNRGNALLKLNRYEEALASYERALSLRPNLAEALSNRGNALLDLKRYEEALASYDRAIEVEPGFAEAYYNRGNVLQDLRRFAEAAASYERAVEIRPDLAEAHSNRGNALQKLNRFDEALASYDRALAANPNFGQALLNRGVGLQELRRFDEAIATYARALALQPDYAEVHFNEAICRLMIGDFAGGWPKYEWGWQAKQRGPIRKIAQPLWLGHDDLAGKTIFIHAEQGFGDTLQFCRYIPMVAARGAKIIFEVQDALVSLMRCLANETTQVVPVGPAPSAIDFHCPLLSLPLAFHTDMDSIPMAAPYLSAPPEAVEHWQARLAPNRRPRIGLAWSGRPTHTNDFNRSIGFRSLSPLLDAEATFVSVQKFVRDADMPALKERTDVLHFGDALADFADTAALIANLDLLIAVDTSVVHLAGALAKPVWMLLPYTPDWRWLLDRDDSPWYPTIRLFRQDKSRSWDPVIARVRRELDDFCAQAGEAHLADAPTR
jgi:tetratricopeptide (TPR) repeat protein